MKYNQIKEGMLVQVWDKGNDHHKNILRVDFVNDECDNWSIGLSNGDTYKPSDLRKTKERKESMIDDLFVNSEHNAKVFRSHLEVGCNRIEWKDFDKIVAAAKKVRK